MAENVLTIKRAWTPLADSSWRNIESIFEVHHEQQLEQKTPPRKVVELSLPSAPRKPLQQPQIRREGLKPRRLTYEFSSPDSGIDADKENQPPPPPPIHESGKSRVKRRQLKAIKDQKTKPASELRLRLRI